jgi:hypothetical protein
MDNLSNNYTIQKYKNSSIIETEIMVTKSFTIGIDNNT